VADKSPDSRKIYLSIAAVVKRILAREGVLSNLSGLNIHGLVQI
jgi:hypothetical protein